MRRLVIVTGLSGAGKSQAMKSLEDFGFACLDNAPPVLARPFVALAEEAGYANAALALDVRTNGPFGEAIGAVFQGLLETPHAELAVTLVQQFERRGHNGPARRLFAFFAGRALAATCAARPVRP